jgi:uncharacterized protein YwqG
MLDDNFLDRMRITVDKPSDQEDETPAEKVVEILRSKGLERIAEPVLRFRTEPISESDIPIGSSRMGGSPDLPLGIAWPTWDGRPLDFLLQLDLAEIPRKWGGDDLPESGWLYFFYDIDRNPWGFDVSHRYGWRVLFYDGDRKNLGRCKRPDNVDPQLRSCGLTFFQGIYVNWPSLQDEKSLSDLRSLDKHEGFVEAILEIFGHQITGRTHGCQSRYEGMQEECQEASHGIFQCDGQCRVFDHKKAEKIKAGITNWRFLLEVRSDDNAGLEWNAYGTLYFWIREDDLRNSDFHNVWALFQCL